MCTEKNNSRSTERLEAVIDALNKGENPYIDVDEVEEIYDTLVERGDVASAEALSAHALTIHPDAPEVLLIRASCLIDKNEHTEAEALLRKIEAIDDSFPDIYIDLGWMQLKQDMPNEAMEQFNKVAQMVKGTDDDILLYEIAMNLNGMGYHSEALKYVDAFLEAHPKHPRALFERAYAMGREGFTDESIALYEEIKELDPFMDLAWYNLGIMLAQQHRIKEALECFETVTTIVPEVADPYLNIANAYIALGEIDKALYNYEEYFSLVPPENRHEHIYRFMGESWAHLGNEDMAYRFLRKATQMMPEDDMAWYDMAYISIEMGRIAKAEMSIDKALAIKFEEAEYHFLKAQILHRKHDKDGIINELMIGLKIDGTAIMAWIEIYNVSLRHMRTAQEKIDMVKFFREFFYDGPTMDFFEAYVRFALDPTDAQVEPLLIRSLQDEDLQTDVVADDNLANFMQDERIKDILKNNGIAI